MSVYTCTCLVSHEKHFQFRDFYSRVFNRFPGRRKAITQILSRTNFLSFVIHSRSNKAVFFCCGLHSPRGVSQHFPSVELAITLFFFLRLSFLLQVITYAAKKIFARWKICSATLLIELLFLLENISGMTIRIEKAERIANETIVSCDVDYFFIDTESLMLIDRNDYNGFEQQQHATKKSLNGNFHSHRWIKFNWS